MGLVGRQAGRDLCKPLEMGAGRGEAAAHGLLQRWGETGELDLEARRKGEDLLLACLHLIVLFLCILFFIILNNF